jgi:hypothetical protein
MVIIHLSAFATVPVLHSESMPSKPTQTSKEELRPFFTNLGTRMRATNLINHNNHAYGLQSSQYVSISGEKQNACPEPDTNKKCRNTEHVRNKAYN